VIDGVPDRGLATKAQGDFRMRVGASGQDLDRDRVLRDAMARLVDDAKAAFAELFDQLVLVDRRRWRTEWRARRVHERPKSVTDI
jgi:hypothetical protein